MNRSTPFQEINLHFCISANRTWMNIGFDAKRAFHNGTGLGHYSRTLLESLATYYPEHEYYLFNPKAGSYSVTGKGLHEVLPGSVLYKLLPSLWRSSGVRKDMHRLKLDLYHGLSHELPLGIRQTGIPSVVTMHDLIHERYPEQYKPIDVKIYSRKFRYACSHADRIIAISQQTKHDLVSFYKVDPAKIAICYQSCNPSFGKPVTEAEKQRIKKIYGLPDRFFLYVGSVIERKNLLNICKAMFLLRNETDIPLVVIGNGTRYKEQVKDYIRQNGLDKRIIFLSDNPVAQSSLTFRTAVDFPAIYQSAIAMIYPSFFEGFGIPVLEALWSRLPVITSNVSCLPEAGGDGSYYVNPNDALEIATGMKRIASDEPFADTMKEKGWQHAQRFTQQQCASEVMKVYEGMVRK